MLLIILNNLNIFGKNKYIYMLNMEIFDKIDESKNYITGNNFKRICDFYINNNKLVPINNNILKPFYGCFIFVRCGQ